VNWDAEQFSTRAQQMGCCAGGRRTPYMISTAKVMKREPAVGDTHRGPLNNQGKTHFLSQTKHKRTHKT
jgi:hypothetical protein